MHHNQSVPQVDTQKYLLQALHGVCERCVVGSQSHQLLELFLQRTLSEIA